MSPSHFLRSFRLPDNAARSASSLRSWETSFFSISAIWTGRVAISRVSSASRLSMSCRRIAQFRSGSIAKKSVTRGTNGLQFGNPQSPRGGIENAQSQRNTEGQIGRVRQSGATLRDPAGGAHRRRRERDTGGARRDMRRIESADPPSQKFEQGRRAEQGNQRDGQRQS